MHRSRLGGIVIDCNCDDIEAAGEFWRKVLGYDVRVRNDLDKSRYVDLETPPTEVGVTIQKVDHQSRVHIDIETDNFEAETKRLIHLGAKLVREMPHWIVFEAPTGHRFCIIHMEREDLSENGNLWD